MTKTIQEQLREAEATIAVQEDAIQIYKDNHEIMVADYMDIGEVFSQLCWLIKMKLMGNL
ncbi:hypothetical protein VCHA38O209_50272 [Vibrio chagasii]|nr:hypothetical protein VCHA38O209_50272 [Vibrio chagasii]